VFLGNSLEFFSEVSSICLAAPGAVPPLPGAMTGKTNNCTTAKIAAPSTSDNSSGSDSSSTSYDALKEKVPSPVGKYVPAKEAGGLLFLAGVGPRSPIDNSIPGGPVFDADGNMLDYDCEAQTRATIENMLATLEGSGSSIDKVSFTSELSFSCVVRCLRSSFRG
jgi:enamine deaminase RidA (YjgF/YER057c/UK114 family)